MLACLCGLFVSLCVFDYARSCAFVMVRLNVFAFVCVCVCLLVCLCLRVVVFGGVSLLARFVFVCWFVLRVFVLLRSFVFLRVCWLSMFVIVCVCLFVC